MIKITNGNDTHTIVPTIFPDGTSQVWKLPQWALDSKELKFIWNFEAEREVIDLLSLRRLLSDQKVSLHVPFMPYGRQDKRIGNDATFNFRVLASLLNAMQFAEVTSVDVHNVGAAEQLIRNFKNITPQHIQEHHINKWVQPDYVVFPDSGARMRYNYLNPDVPLIICEKERDQATGTITGHKLRNQQLQENFDIPEYSSFLILDDICDGGATFISVAKMIHERCKKAKVILFVTHGIFSRGREHLLTNGIKEVYTTNSLLKNNEGYGV